MMNLSDLFASPALAQTGAVASAAGSSSTFMSLLPMALIFAVFFFLVIRPQQKKIGEQEKMIKALQRGDRVITSGGIHGKIVRLEGDDILILEIADGVQVKVSRTFVQGLTARRSRLAWRMMLPLRTEDDFL